MREYIGRAIESSIVTKCAIVMDVLSDARQPLAFLEDVRSKELVKSSCHSVLTVPSGRRADRVL